MLSALVALVEQGAWLMLEADVSMSANGVPIMCHPPHTTSDLTAEAFLTETGKAMGSPPGSTAPLAGVKLDFKVRTERAEVGEPT